MMIYDIYGGTVIDFIDGRQALTYVNIPRKDDSEKFMCHNYRMSIGIESKKSFDLHQSWASNRLKHETGFVFGENITVFIPYDNMSRNTTRNIDYMIVTAAYTGNPYDLLEVFQADTVVLDKSMDWDRFYKWKRILKYKNIKTINLFNHGATKINL